MSLETVTAQTLVITAEAVLDLQRRVELIERALASYAIAKLEAEDAKVPSDSETTS